MTVDFLEADFFVAVPFLDAVFFDPAELFLLAAFLVPVDFFEAVFLGPPELFLEAFFFLGTLSPLSRASESPIAIACLRLVTFFPERPLFSLPSFISCMASSTFSEEPLAYFRAIV